VGGFSYSNSFRVLFFKNTYLISQVMVKLGITSVPSISSSKKAKLPPKIPILPLNTK
jgi:hypothetical protein